MNGIILSSISVRSWLFVGAFSGEIDLLQNSATLPHVHALGIGNLEAGLRLQSLLQSLPEIRSVLFLGSCGFYPWNPLDIGSIIPVSQVHSEEPGVFLNQGKQVDSREPLSLSNLSSESDLDFSTPSICNAPRLLTLLEWKSPPSSTWKSFAVENLELYGVAKACKAFQIPLYSLLGVTNRVGPDGSKDWSQNWKKVSHVLQNRVLDFCSA